MNTTVFYWWSEAFQLESHSLSQACQSCCAWRCEGKWVKPSHSFLDLTQCEHSESKSCQPLFLERLKTTLSLPIPCDPCRPSPKSYLKIRSSKLYLSFLEGEGAFQSLTHRELAEAGPVSHLLGGETGKTDGLKLCSPRKLSFSLFKPHSPNIRNST